MAIDGTFKSINKLKRLYGADKAVICQYGIHIAKLFAQRFQLSSVTRKLQESQTLCKKVLNLSGSYGQPQPFGGG